MWHQYTWVMYSALYIKQVYASSPSHVSCSISKWVVGFLLILPDREWFVIILSCQTHNNTKWRHLLKDMIVNYMQIQTLLPLINTETQLLDSCYNIAESNPMDFTFPCELSISFDLNLFFFFSLLEKENLGFFEYLYNLYFHTQTC